MYVRDIIPIISYGQFSKPFTSFLEEYADNRDIRLYLHLLKDKWVLSTDELFEQIDSTIQKCRNSGIKYLLLSDKLDVAKNLTKRELNKKLYRKLIREFKKIPQDFRTIIGKGLKSNNAYTKEYSSKEFRMWSAIYQKDELDNAINLHAEAFKMLNILQMEKKRKKIEKQEISERTEKICNIFFEASENAKMYPHPTFLLSGLNNATWYNIKTDINKASEFAGELAYYCGFYLEDAYSIINYLDTIITTFKTVRDPLFFIFGQFFIYFFKKDTQTQPASKNPLYKQNQYILKYVFYDYERSNNIKSIKNTKGLKSFLSDRIRRPNEFAKASQISPAAVYSILKGRTEKISFKTMEKIMDTLELEISYDNPKILNELLLIKREKDAFQHNWQQFKACSKFEREKINLRNYFAAVFYEHIDIAAFFKLDLNDLYNYIIEEKNRIRFFNIFYSRKNPFYRARIDLIEKLFVKIKKREDFSRLIRFISGIKGTRNHELISLFFRQYIRYRSIEWKFSPEDVLSTRKNDPNHRIILEFCEKMKLSELFSYIAFWSLGSHKKDILKLLELKGF